MPAAPKPQRSPEPQRVPEPEAAESEVRFSYGGESTGRASVLSAVELDESGRVSVSLSVLDDD